MLKALSLYLPNGWESRYAPVQLFDQHLEESLSRETRVLDRKLTVLNFTPRRKLPAALHSTVQCYGLVEHPPCTRPCPATYALRSNDRSYMCLRTHQVMDLRYHVPSRTRLPRNSQPTVLPPCSTGIHCSIRRATMLDLQHPNFGPMIDHMYVLTPTKSWTSAHTYRYVPGSARTLSPQYRN